LGKDNIDGHELAPSKFFVRYLDGFQLVLKCASAKKIFTPISNIRRLLKIWRLLHQRICKLATDGSNKKQSKLIREVSLLDKYKTQEHSHRVSKFDKNLNDKEVGEIRDTILKVLKKNSMQG